MTGPGLRMVGLGALSGVAGDPGPGLVRPGALDDPERKELMRLELFLGAAVPDVARYILGFAEK